MTEQGQQSRRGALRGGGPIFSRFIPIVNQDRSCFLFFVFFYILILVLAFFYFYFSILVQGEGISFADFRERVRSRGGRYVCGPGGRKGQGENYSGVAWRHIQEVDFYMNSASRFLVPRLPANTYPFLNSV